MIKILRYVLIGSAGAAISFSLISTPNPAFPLLSALVSLLWLFLGSRFRWIHLFALPLYTVAVLAGFLFDGTLLSQSLLYILFLTAWECDSLFMDSGKAMHRDSEKILLIHLLAREAISLIAIALAFALTNDKGPRIGFWPLAAIVVLLIVTLRKLFSIKDD